MLGYKAFKVTGYMQADEVALKVRVVYNHVTKLGRGVGTGLVSGGGGVSCKSSHEIWRHIHR